MWQYRLQTHPNELYHYASKYYDPVKAHEYYEQHKKLKGDKPKVTLNEEGHKVADYVKSQVYEERDKNLESENERYKKESEQRSDVKSRTIEQHRDIMNRRINSLKNSIKNMPEAQRKAAMPKIKAVISKLKAENEAKRTAIQEQYNKDVKSSVESHSNTNKGIRENAKSTYEKEYDRITSESKYIKPSKSKGKEKKKWAKW